MSDDKNPRVAYASEREALEGFLDYQREGLLLTLEGLDDAAARKAPTASSLSLLGLVKHAATWERRWFQVIMAGRKLPENWPAVETEPRPRLTPGRGWGECPRRTRPLNLTSQLCVRVRARRVTSPTIAAEILRRQWTHIGEHVDTAGGPARNDQFRAHP